MPYNRTGKISQVNDDETISEIDFDYSVDPKKYSDLDLANGVIFVPISSEFSIQFTRNIFSNSVTASTDENLIRGSVQLTHLGLSSTSSGNNNFLTLTNQAKPSSIIESSVLNAYENDIVMMSTVSTTSDTVDITPKINLSSNTVYFLNLSSDNIKDYNEKEISFEIGNGFMTDNSRSFYLSDYGLYSGFSVNVNDSDLTLDFLELPNDKTERQVVLINRVDGEGNIILDDNGVPIKEPKEIVAQVPNDVNLEQYRINFSSQDSFYLFRDTDTKSTFNINKPLFGTIDDVEPGKITFNMDYSCYYLNVAYVASGSNTKITTTSNHNLLDDDSIYIYDVVSGDITSGKYFVKKIDSKNFTVPFNISSKRSGRLNFHPTLSENQSIVNVKKVEGQDKVTKKIIKSQQNIITYSDREEIVNHRFNTIIYGNPSSNGVLSPATNEMLGRIIRGKTTLINYVPLNTDEQIVDDTFVNNSIIELFSDDNKKIIGHIKANTFPNHNVHPFNTSAPNISSFYPAEGTSSTSKIKIVTISRVADVGRVITNIKHTLSEGDNIYIEGYLETIFTGIFTVSTVLNDFTFEFILTKTINENSPFNSNQQLKLLYFNKNLEKTANNLSDTDNYLEKSSIFQVSFSQSMNVSTISVANSTHILVANGSIIEFNDGITKESSTIQISKSGTDFSADALIDFDLISSNTGNAEFTIHPTNLDKFSTYFIRIKNQISDLGGTRLTYDYTLREPITTGTRPGDSENITDEPYDVPIYDLDTTAPQVKKIYFTDSNTNSELYQVVLDSLNVDQITDPIDYKTVEVDLNDESLVIMFDESIDSSTVTVNTQNTRPFGTVQLSCDDFITVVQMQEPLISTTTNQSDTYTFKPVANLSSNSTYTLQISSRIGDTAINKNFLIGDKNSDIRSVVLDTGPNLSNYFIKGETIRGTRKLFVNTTLNLPDLNFNISGLENGKIFYGLTSGGRGKVYDYQTELVNGIEKIISIEYTPIETGRYIIDLKPGETCYFEDDDSYRFSINFTAITSSPEGIVIRYIPDEKRIIYREINPLYTFDRVNDRIYGYQSKGIGRTSDPSDIELAGFKTTDDTNQVTYYATDINEDILTNSSNNIIDIKPNTNFTFKFSQTMNTSTLIFNNSSGLVRNNDNVIVSYDSNFSNCIPLENFTKSNNDTTFSFTPAMYTSNYQLSQNSSIYVKASNTTLTKGGTISTSLGHTNYFKVSNTNSFQILHVYVYTGIGSREELLEIDPGQYSNTISGILTSTFIEIIFNETVDPATITLGQGNSVELTTDSTFTSNFVTSGTISIYDLHKNRIIITPTSYFLNLTDYYLRINTSIENPYGVALNKMYTFDKFTVE